MASHRHTAIAPVTVIDSTTKKYSSGKAISSVSTCNCPRSHCNRDPYLSNKSTDTNPPGIANSVSTRPTPRSSPSASVSPPPRKMRSTNSSINRQKGCSRRFSHCRCKLMSPSSHRGYRRPHAPCLRRPPDARTYSPVTLPEFSRYSPPNHARSPFPCEESARRCKPSPPPPAHVSNKKPSFRYLPAPAPDF